MLPAHQGFHAHGAPGGEVHHRLVNEKQLVARQRLAQVGLDGQRVHHTVVHRVIEDHIAVASGTLGFVHRGVGVAQNLCRPQVLALPAHHADAGAALHRVVGNGVGLTQVGQQPLGDGRYRRVVAHAFQHHHKLVAAQARGHGVTRLHARQRVARAQRELQALRDLAQQLVAGAMAQRVVDLLEAVEVHEQHREAVPRVALRMRNGTRQALHHGLAVGQLRQRVSARGLVQAVLQRTAVGGVDEAGDHAGQFALGVVLGHGVN